MVDMKKGMHIGQWGVVLGIAAVCIARLAFAESKGSLLTQIGQFQLLEFTHFLTAKVHLAPINKG